MEVVQLLGSQGLLQHQVLRGVGSQGSRKYSALEGYGNPCWPIHSSILAWRTPLREKPGRPQFIESQRVGHYQSDPVCTGARLLLPMATLPQWGLSMKVVQLLGFQRFLQHQVLRGVGS